MNKAQPKVTIILLNYRAWEDTIECASSLLKLDYDNFNIIIIDNNSPNDSVLQLKKWLNNELIHFLPPDHAFREYSLPAAPIPGYLHLKASELASFNGDIPKLTFIESEHNGGYAAGNNIGLKFCLAADPEFAYAWVLNNDTVVAKDALSGMMAEIQRLKTTQPAAKLGFYGHRITNYHDPSTDQVSYYGFNQKTATVTFFSTRKPGSILLNEDRFYPCGASIFVSKAFIEEVGLMEERYFLYYEEPDWSIRAHQKGYTLVIFNDIPVFHKEGASAGSNSDGSQRSELSDLYIIKNRFTIIRKFYPKNIPYVYISMAGVIINRIRRKQFDRVRMIAGILKKEFLNS